MFSKLSKTIFNLISLLSRVFIPQGFHKCATHTSTVRRHQKQIKSKERARKKKKFLCIFNFHLQLINWIAAMISCLRSWLFGESESNTNRCTYKCMKNFAENKYSCTRGEDSSRDGGRGWWRRRRFIACLMPFRIEHLQYMCACNDGTMAVAHMAFTSSTRKCY